MSDLNILRDLQKACSDAGVTLRHVSNGHYHIQGEVLVNYWPLSPKRTANAAGSKGRSATPVEAVSMAVAAPGTNPDESSYYTIFGRPVSEEEFRSFELPETPGAANPPWEK